MRYWGVNQNQTFEQEVRGGYLWSPKCQANGTRNPFYEYMHEVDPGDLVLWFQGTDIRAIGSAESHAYECPKRPEFGPTGPNWARIGWNGEMLFVTLVHQIRPVDYLNTLAPHLPARQAPLQQDGRGKQSVYLTELSRIERACRVTGVDRIEHLRASHILPWRDSDNHQRLDGENGMLLTPSIDHLFDRGFISVEDDGCPIVSPVAHSESLRRMGISRGAPMRFDRFSEGQRTHLD